MLKELRPGSCVGLVSSPGILRAAEVILHSMRGNELLLMTATRMWAVAPRPQPRALRPAQPAWWSRACARTAPIDAHAPGALRRELPQHRYDRLRKEIGHQTPAAASGPLRCLITSVPTSRSSASAILFAAGWRLCAATPASRRSACTGSAIAWTCRLP